MRYLSIIALPDCSIQGLLDLGKGVGPHKRETEQAGFLPRKGNGLHTVQADSAVLTPAFHVRLKFRDRQRNQILSQFLHPRKRQLDRLRETAHFFAGIALPLSKI